MPNLERSNRLGLEKSPYLLQHAHNPVDWYPWGEDAFAKARAEDKPIFLSIGYSTCHWCHVMERESFENDAIAAILNREFVPVKVDREERPDVDRIYMAFVQATTGSGGWPMSVFLTPSLAPFFGGTYFPPDSRYGRPGFPQLLEYLARKWHTERSKIAEAGIQTLGQLKQMAAGENEADSVNQEALDRAFSYFRRIFDAELGGFGQAPKFPRPVVHNFLLRYFAASGNQEAVDMVSFTLGEMAKGGMNDQVGGGFHRYSVDSHWFVPHFEKMLYDQAQLASSFIETFQITGDAAHAANARSIFEYVGRDLTHPEGGFYSAEDADSVIDDEPGAAHKGEGAFYTWKDADVRALLGPDADEFCRTYGVRPNGNVDEDPHHEFVGKNILYLAQDVKEPAVMAAARAILLKERAKRTRPHLDDKVLTAWNGLMISAFAQGARVLGDPHLLEAATRAAHFVLRHLYKPEEGRLLRRFRDGEAAIPGFLDDYAFFIQGLLDLYEASHDTDYFLVAVQLADSMVELFEDEERGGFYSTTGEDASLVMRMKDDYDGAEPSGNSYAIQVLLKLAHLTGREDFGAAAKSALEAFSGKLATQGPALPQMLAAWLSGQKPPQQIVLVGAERDAAMEAMLRSIAQHFLPFSTTIAVHSEAAREALAKYMPTVVSMTAVDGRTTAYVCENFACQLPVTEVELLAKLLH